MNTSDGRKVHSPLAVVLTSTFTFSVAVRGFSKGLDRLKKEQWHKMPNSNFESFLNVLYFHGFE